MTDHDPWIQKLISQDSENAQLRRRYDDALLATQRRSAGSATQIWHTVLSIIGCAGGLAVANLALTEPAGTPALTRAFLLMLAAFAMSWSVLFAVTSLRRWPVTGPQRSAAVWMAFGFTLLSALMSAVAVVLKGASPAAFGLLGMTSLLVVVAAVLVVHNRIRQAELRLRMDVLSVELRLARVGRGGAESAL